MNDKKIKNACKKIKLVISDVDGVLTDGGLYYSVKGETLKKFHVRDGMGISMLKKNGIPTVILSKEKSKIVTKWCKNMPVKKIFDGAINKEKTFEKICKIFKIDTSEVAYIGDDINDLGLLKMVGFSATPADAVKDVTKNVDYICNTKGGKGAFREVSDLILKVQFPKKKTWY